MHLSRRVFLLGAAAGLAGFKPDKPALAHHYFVEIPIWVTHVERQWQLQAFKNSVDSAIGAGYSFVSIYDALKPIVSGQPLEVKNPAVMTIDDGYLNNLELITFLADRRINAVLFLIPGYQDGDHSYIAIEQYPDIIAAGQTAGAHTTTHLDLPTISLERAVNDARLSKELIEQATGKECNIFAFPNGSFNDTLVDELKGSFTAAFSTANGVARYRGGIPFRPSARQHFPENWMCLNRVYGL